MSNKQTHAASSRSDENNNSSNASLTNLWAGNTAGNCASRAVATTGQITPSPTQNSRSSEDPAASLNHPPRADSTFCDPIEDQESKIQHRENSLARPRQRNGKVARLAKKLRDQISQAILDGIPYKKIIENLGADGAGLTENCLSTYKKGGHQDWLHEQQLLHESRLRHEFTFDLAREDSSINAYTAANKLAAAMICEAIAELGPQRLRSALLRDPLNIVRIFNSLSRLTTSGIRCEQHLADAQPQGAARDPNDPPGLSAEAREIIERELNLL